MRQGLQRPQFAERLLGRIGFECRLVGGFTSRGRDPGPAQTWAHALVGAISSTITWWSATRTITRDEVVDNLFLLIWSGFSGMDTPVGDTPLP